MTSPSPQPLSDRQREREEARERADRAQGAGAYLARLNGATELHAATLALMLPPNSQRAVRAWQIETADSPSAAASLEHVSHLAPAARLPWFETLVSRMRDQSIGARQNLLEATRRLMSARGIVRPIDRLHWFDMRQRLGAATRAGAHNAAADDLSRLPQTEVTAIAMYTAFLSRMVPVDSAESDIAQGLAWYDAVMEPWRAHAEVQAHQRTDTDGLVHSLLELQSMAWMQRPMLVRGWVVAATEHSLHRRLSDSAADALRLTCSLLDSPLPPELARHFENLPEEFR
jgi:hypothetical protein